MARVGMMPTKPPYAIAWPTYVFKDQAGAQYSMWHWSGDGKRTACNLPIPAGDGLRENYIDKSKRKVECKSCLRVLSVKAKKKRP